MRRAYLDNNATTPLDPRVLAVVDTALRCNTANPSSLHAEGRAARRLVEDARRRVAEALGADPAEIVFTASATEADNLAVSGLAGRAPAGRRRILASPTEHPAVLEPLRRLEGRGFEVEWLPITSAGELDLAAARARLAADVAFSALMAVNNEVGTIQPVAEWAAACAAFGVPLHCDGVQAVGRLPLDLAAAGVATFALSAHKFHGPRGVGALFVRRDTPLEPLVVGGEQERGRRAGTENVAAIAGLAEALVLACDERAQRVARVQALEERLLAGVRDEFPKVVLNGADAPRVAGTTSLRFDGFYGETMLMNLDLRGVSVSLGSACSSGSIEPSHVLRAMGLDTPANYASVRVSLSSMNDERDVDAFVDAVRDIVAARR